MEVQWAVVRQCGYLDGALMKKQHAIVDFQHPLPGCSREAPLAGDIDPNRLSRERVFTVQHDRSRLEGNIVIEEYVQMDTYTPFARGIACLRGWMVSVWDTSSGYA
jgi:hypothetical protein